MAVFFDAMADLVTVKNCGAAFQRLKLRSLQAEQALLAEEGGILTGAEFASRLGVASVAAVDDLREQGQLFGVVGAAGERQYPAWQIQRGQLLPGLAATLEVFIASGDFDPLGVTLFFLTEAEALDDERPLDLLRRGEVKAVVAHAAWYIDRR